MIPCPVLWGRFTQRFSFALELLRGGQRVPLPHRAAFTAEKQEPRDTSVVERGGIGLSSEDQRRGEEGTDFRQEETRACLAASVL